MRPVRGEGSHGQSTTIVCVSRVVLFIGVEIVQDIVGAPYLQIRVAPEEQRLPVLLVAMIREVRVAIAC